MIAILSCSLLLSDPYIWLEETEKEETKVWIDNQTTQTKSLLENLSSKNQIRDRLLKLFNYEQLGTPISRGDLLFFLDRNLYMEENGLKKVLINPLSALIGTWNPSPDGTLIAYTLSEAANDKASLHILNVTTGEILPQFISSDLYPCMHSEIEWSQDSKGFWYTKRSQNTPIEEEKFHQKIYYHKLEANFEDDPLIFGENLEKEEVPYKVEASDSGHLLISLFNSSAKQDLFLDNICILKDIQSAGTLYKNRIYVIADRKLLTSNIDTPTNWEIILSQGPHQKFFIIDDLLFVESIVDVHSVLKTYDLKGAYYCDIPLPGLGTVTSFSIHKGSLLFGFTSFLIPQTIYRYDLSSFTLEVFKEIDSGFDPNAFTVEQCFYPAKDLCNIPIYLIYKKPLLYDGNNPTLLYGYGGFNISILPSFNRTMIPFLENGGVYVIANIRGGGEYGEPWHEAGMLKNKQTVFDDFISAAEWLIKSDITNAGKLAIMGGSNGGLLTGAMLTQRPDLFKAIIIGVPVLDMLRYHLFFGGRHWIPEYGSPDDEEMVPYLLSYSPYHNIKDDCAYPATLIFTSDRDDRVHPMHAYKMTARLQSINQPPKILLRVEKNAGHSGNPSDSGKIEFYSDIYSFLFDELGMD